MCNQINSLLQALKNRYPDREFIAKPAILTHSTEIVLKEIPGTVLVNNFYFGNLTFDNSNFATGIRGIDNKVIHKLSGTSYHFENILFANFDTVSSASISFTGYQISIIENA